MTDRNYDMDARNDPFFAAYERARDLIPTQDWQDAIQKIEQLAEQGSLMSILYIADAMRVGRMYNQDLYRAEKWYEAAEKSGSVRGTFGLGLTYLLMKRTKKAIEKLEEAANNGYPPAYNSLAVIHFRGDGVDTNKVKAKQLWRQAGSLGHLPAKQNLIAAQLRGQYGISGYIEGLIRFVPTVIEVVSVRMKNPYTDLLR